MVEVVPRAEGELSFVAPPESLMGAFEGTPWQAQAAEVNAGIADPRTAALIGLAIDASANMAHACQVAEGTTPSLRESATTDGVLAGMGDSQIFEYARSRGHEPRDEAVVSSHRQSLVEQIRTGLTRQGEDDLAVAIDEMNTSASRLMESGRYDARPAHQAITMITRNACPHRRHADHLTRETRAMVHHLSDSELAPPAVLLTQTLVEGLSHWRERYLQWSKYAGISPSDERYRLMGALLGIGNAQPRTMRQLMALHPDRAEEIASLVSDHLQEMFLSIARAPEDCLPSVPEKRRAANRLRLGAVAEAVGAAAMQPGSLSRARTGKGKGAKPWQPQVKTVEKAPRNRQSSVVTAQEVPIAEDIISDLNYATSKSRQTSSFGRDYVNGSAILQKGSGATAETSVRLSEDLVSVYLDEISHTPLLNAIQEVVLAKAIEAGLYAERTLEELRAATAGGEPVDQQYIRDLVQIQRTGEQAKDLFWRANLRLVIGYANAKKGRGLPFLDLVQEGNLGVNRAVEKFDYTKGYKFSTYATWWIHHFIGRALAEQAHTVRIPVQMVEMINSLGRVIRDFVADQGRQPTPDEMAKLLKVKVSTVNELICLGQDPVSLNQPVGDEEDAHLGDFVADPDVPEAFNLISSNLLRTAIEQVMKLLKTREQNVLRLRFGFGGGKPMSYQAIGEQLGCSRETIRKIEIAAFAKIRASKNGETLQGLLD